MKTISHKITQLSSSRKLLMVFVIFLIFPVFILNNAEKKIKDGNKAVLIPDMQLGFSSQQLVDMLQEMSKVGRKEYFFTEVVTDIIYPIVYTLLMLIILSLLFYKSPSVFPIPYLNLLPFFLLLVDWIENINIALVMMQTDMQVSIFAHIASIFNHLKWGMVVLIVLLILLGTIRKIVLRIKRIKGK